MEHGARKYMSQDGHPEYELWRRSSNMSSFSQELQKLLDLLDLEGGRNVVIPFEEHQENPVKVSRRDFTGSNRSWGKNK